MSLRALTGNTGYFYSELINPITSIYGTTFVFKIKFDSASAIEPILTYGSAYNRLITVTKNSSKLRVVFDQGISADEITMNSVTTSFVSGKEYFVAVNLRANNDRRIFIHNITDDTSEYLTNTDIETQSWGTPAITKVGLLTNKIAISTSTVTEDGFLSDVAIFSENLSEAQLIALGQGLTYNTYSATNDFWFCTDNETLYYHDIIDSNEPDVVDAVTGLVSTIESLTVAPVYSADHPVMGSGVTLSDLSTVVGLTTADITVTTNTGNGTIWAGVFAAGSTPSHAEIKAGTGALGSGMVSVIPTATGSQVLPQITGLSEATSYRVWVTQESATAVESNQVSEDITTSNSASLQISATIVEDSSNTLYASKTGLHYVVLSDTDGESFVVEYEGSAGTTDANGIITISTPTSQIGDKLSIIVFGEADTDIHASTVLRAIGTSTVQEV